MSHYGDRDGSSFLEFMGVCMLFAIPIAIYLNVPEGVDHLTKASSPWLKPQEPWSMKLNDCAGCKDRPMVGANLTVELIGHRSYGSKYIVELVGGSWCSSHNPASKPTGIVGTVVREGKAHLILPSNINLAGLDVCVLIDNNVPALPDDGRGRQENQPVKANVVVDYFIERTTNNAAALAVCVFLLILVTAFEASMGEVLSTRFSTWRQRRTYRPPGEKSEGKSSSRESMGKQYEQHISDDGTAEQRAQHTNKVDADQARYRLTRKGKRDRRWNMQHGGDDNHAGGKRFWYKSQAGGNRGRLGLTTGQMPRHISSGSNCKTTQSTKDMNGNNDQRQPGVVPIVVQPKTPCDDTSTIHKEDTPLDRTGKPEDIEQPPKSDDKSVQPAKSPSENEYHIL